MLSLNKWGQYASDVQLVLQRTGPSASERPISDGRARVPERGLYRQSLPPPAKLRPSGMDRSLKRREPKRKSLTFTGGAKGLRDIFGKSRDGEGMKARLRPGAVVMHLDVGSNLHPFISAKQLQQHSVSLNLQRLGGTSVPGSPARELSRLVRLQRDKLQALESRLLGCEAEMRDWDAAAGEASQVSQAARLPAPTPASHQSLVFS